MIIVPDYSSNNTQPPAFALRDKYGFWCYIRKLSMGGGPDNRLEDILSVRKAWAAMGGYHWNDPTQKWKIQSDIFLNQIKIWNPNFLAFDIEQGWPWKDANNLDYSKIIPPNQIYDNAAQVVPYVVRECGKPYMIYTSKGFVDQCCPDLGKWIGAQPLWCASYPDLYYLTRKLTWPFTMGKFPYKPAQAQTPAKDIVEFMANADPKTMQVPTGATNPVLWQITSRCLAWPECTEPYDLSKNVIPDEDFRKLVLGEDYIPSVVPSPENDYGRI